jgi:hypothetical protein
MPSRLIPRSTAASGADEAAAGKGASPGWSASASADPMAWSRSTLVWFRAASMMRMASGERVGSRPLLALRAELSGLGRLWGGLRRAARTFFGTLLSTSAHLLGP